jgi:hypothetical protein
VISLDFASVATWPKVRWFSTDQALTMCSGDRPTLRRITERGWARKRFLVYVARGNWH